MSSVGNVGPVFSVGGEEQGHASGDEEISSMPSRVPALMVAREIVVWTPTGFLEMALSRVLGALLLRRQRTRMRAVPQIELVE